MSRLTELVARAKASDPKLAKELEEELQHIMKRQHFGLVFERHLPEAVELPYKSVRPRDKVRILPPRGSSEKGSPTLWKVQRIVKTGEGPAAQLVAPQEQEPERALVPKTVPVDDLVVVAEITDTIYPGLEETGRVERGKPEDPFHTVINAENFHALAMLTYTHRHSIDAIYIDPPYNTGAKDWKYNNDYVEGDDEYRHSKWLSMMERRLLLAKELLDPENSVLIVTIDEKEYLRLGLLLEQTFPEAKIQMVTSVINPKGTSRPDSFARVEEFIFFVLLGSARIPDLIDESKKGKPVRMRYLRREDMNSVRGSRPRQFYPVYISKSTGRIVGTGEPLDPNDPLDKFPAPDGCTAVFPIREDGLQMEWGLSASTLMRAVSQDYVRVTPGHKFQPYIISYLTEPNIRKVESGELVVEGVREDGSKIVVSPDGKKTRPQSVWRIGSHSAGDYGTKLNVALMPDRRFPFPKSLYAVEDALRFFVADKPAATILDFFAGSGTTAHAVMRLNKQDGGKRQTISITNNEVSLEEQKKLRKKGLRLGEAEWEELGICNYITKPRIRAAITGKTPEGKPIKGNYKFTDEFPMSDGFEANAIFFTLTYENSLAVAYHKTFKRVAPLLWLRAGSEGRMIEQIPDKGWDVADTYAILENLDRASEFINAVSKQQQIKIAYIVTDDDRRFQMICRGLPSSVEPIRLYQSYLLNFQLNDGRGVA